MESNPDCHGCPHEANHRTAPVLCHLCSRHRNEKGKHRPQDAIDQYLALCKLARNRGNGARFQCDICGAIEPKVKKPKPNATSPGTKGKNGKKDGKPRIRRFCITEDTAEVCCPKCKAKRARGAL
ncbi:hypothetical protein BJX68DRAFT_234681 [Aspergillus pseudodeflectus]|uniref:Stc1 domain-containing protein n=1 Tax=Aspergillus pseudodeflectus TaxID=176178 RepID=A0ABR4KKC9_9EURO